MIQRVFALLTLTSVLCGVLGGLTGCSSQTAASAPQQKLSQLPVDEQIRRIQANPDMPPPAKQAAIAKLRGSQATTP